jgi:hypothetical protein
MEGLHGQEFARIGDPINRSDGSVSTGSPRVALKEPDYARQGLDREFVAPRVNVAHKLSAVHSRLASLETIHYGF